MDQTDQPDQTGQPASDVQSYTGTELDPALDVDFDLDDFEDEQNDTMRIVGLAVGGVAALGIVLWLLGRRSRPKPGLAGVVERVSDDLQSTGKDVRKAIEHSDLSKIDVNELIDELRHRAGQLHIDREVEDALKSARHRARAVADNVDTDDLKRRARRVGKEARHAADSVDTDDLKRRARRVGREAKARIDDVDPQDVQNQFEHFTNRVVEAINNLRGDSAPSLGDRASGAASEAANLVDENLPKAREAARAAAENLRDLLEQGRDRGSHLIDERGPAVQKAAKKGAEQAGEGAGKLADVLKVVALEVLDRVLSDVLPAAKKGSETVADRVKDDTLPFMRHRAADVAEQVRGRTFPFVRNRATDVAGVVRDDLAPRVRKLADDAPDRVREAVDTARPAVSDAAQQAGDAAQHAADRARAALEESGARLGHAADDVRDGVGSGVVSVRRRANTVVRETKKTTGYLTKESSGLLFWLAMLGGLILFVFVPDKDRQGEMWHGIRQLLGELQQMWGDFQSDDLAEDADAEFTGDQA